MSIRQRISVARRSIKTFTFTSATLAFAVKAAAQVNPLAGAAVSDKEAGSVYGAACTIYVTLSSKLGCCYSCTFPFSNEGTTRSEQVTVTDPPTPNNRNGLAGNVYTNCGCGAGNYFAYGNCNSPDNP